MSFTTDNLLGDAEISVIVQADTSLDVSEEVYSEYLKNLDESILTFKDGEEPTRWIMKRTLPLKHATKIENSKVRYDKSGEIQIQLGNAVHDEIRAALKDIRNPDSVPEDKALKLKFTGDGFVRDDIFEKLVACGIVQNLYTARQAAISVVGSVKKK